MGRRGRDKRKPDVKKHTRQRIKNTSAGKGRRCKLKVIVRTVDGEGEIERL